jgi:hypothetical protein
MSRMLCISSICLADVVAAEADRGDGHAGRAERTVEHVAAPFAGIG